MSKLNQDVLLPLTAKEKTVLEFIEGYSQNHGIAPSYQEIREHFGLASFNSVQRYLQQLQKKNYIYVPGGNLKRAITVLHSANESLRKVNHPILNPTMKGTPLSHSLATESLSLPLLGRVAAGRPIERIENDEFISVPASSVRYPERSYALRVEGQSMVEDGILDGDIIFVQSQETAKNGDTVVAVVDNQATVKRFYSHFVNKENLFVHSYPQSHAQTPKAPIELRPANASMSSLWYQPDQVSIKGLVVGLLRRY